MKFPYDKHQLYFDTWNVPFDFIIMGVPFWDQFRFDNVWNWWIPLPVEQVFNIEDFQEAVIVNTLIESNKVIEYNAPVISNKFICIYA